MMQAGDTLAAAAKEAASQRTEAARLAASLDLEQAETRTLRTTKPAAADSEPAGNAHARRAEQQLGRL